jgi:hypothetical protein
VLIWAVNAPETYQLYDTAIKTRKKNAGPFPGVQAQENKMP